MTEKDELATLMKPIRRFLKDRKIKYRDLAKEMMYSASHVSKCLSGFKLPNERFMRGVSHYIADIIFVEDQEHQQIKKHIKDVLALIKEKDLEHNPRSQDLT
jgi:DNA transposition AAA+ family ATPase